MSDYDGIIVGPTSHPIVPVLAAELVARGMRIAAINGGGADDRTLTDGVEILACEPRVDAATIRRADRLSKRYAALERRVVFPTSQKSLAAFEDFGPPAAASIVPSIRRGEYAASVINQLRPRFVWLNHVFQFGWVAPRIEDAAVLAMPWGGDIYNLGQATWLARRMVGKALRCADAVVPSAETAHEVLTGVYGVSADHVHALSWGVDLQEFRDRLDGQRTARRRALDLPVDDRIVFNSRRLKPAWGSDQSLRVMVETARARPNTHHVVLAGGDASAAADEAKAMVEHEGLADQFRIISEDVSMSTFLDYCAAADVAISLRSTRDMRSLSILQCVAAGADLVCSDQPEYRAMERAGFLARFVDEDDHDGVLRATLAAVDAPPEEQARRAAAGREFIDNHEDRETQIGRVVDLIEETTASR